MGAGGEKKSFGKFCSKQLTLRIPGRRRVKLSRWKKFESGVIKNVEGFELEGKGEVGKMEIQECEVVIRGYIKKGSQV